MKNGKTNLTKRVIMKNFFIVTIMALVLFIAGCGSKVEIPPAHVGKILTKNGFAPETLTPSKFRLEPCIAYCDRLVLLEVSDSSLVEKLTVFMPKDKLNITVDIRGTFSIPDDDRTLNVLFDRVPAVGESTTTKINAINIYNIYGRQAVRGIVRSEITKYSIQDVLENRATIGENIHAAITSKLKETKTPLNISRFELADVQPPKVIVMAQEAAKKREIDIQKTEADAQIELVKAEKDLEIAKKNRLVEREKAEAIAEQNHIAAKSITPQILAYKKLETAVEIYTALAASNNTIIVPADSSGFSDITGEATLAKLLGKELKK